MGEAKGSMLKFREYPSVFWTVITLELLERGAYYGIMGYFPIHCMVNLGFSGTQFGILYAVLVFLLYFIPLIASSLARKYGYKAILLVAFAMLAPTYFILTFVGSFYAIFLLIIAWGLGAGAFKPMISATIAEVTEKAKRNSAFSIYYLSINWGSLIAMVGIGLTIPQAFAHIAFAVGGVLITANLLITLFLYRNPVEPDPNEKIKDALKKLVKILEDKKFTILLIIYAGFFFIFSSMHTFLPAYYIEFGIKPWGWLEAPLISALNPLTIVMLGPFLAKYMDRFDSLKLMIAGMFLFSTGLFLLGMVPLWYVFALGMFIFTIGEFLTHPNFISYVSKIAPEEKVALYMGYAFLPSAVGQVFGSIFGGMMWDNISVDLERPSLFWGIYAALGLISIGNFLIYNRWITRKKGIVPKKRSFFTSKLSNVGVYFLVFLVIFLGYSSGITHYIEEEKEAVITTINLSEFDLIEAEPYLLNDYADEGQQTPVPFTIVEESVANVHFRMTWRDEPDSDGTHTNEPDSFSISVASPDGSFLEEGSSSNSQGVEGTIEFTLTLFTENDPPHEMPFMNGTGEWVVVVSVNAGDHEPLIPDPIFGLRTVGDTGNDFDLEITYQYFKKK